MSDQLKYIDMPKKGKSFKNQIGIPKIRENNILYSLRTDKPIVVYKKKIKNKIAYFTTVPIEGKVFYKRISFRKGHDFINGTTIKIEAGKEILFPNGIKNFDPIPVVYITHYKVLVVPEKSEEEQIKEYLQRKNNKYKKV